MEPYFPRLEYQENKIFILEKPQKMFNFQQEKAHLMELRHQLVTDNITSRTFKSCCISHLEAINSVLLWCFCSMGQVKQSSYLGLFTGFKSSLLN